MTQRMTSYVETLGVGLGLGEGSGIHDAVPFLVRIQLLGDRIFRKPSSVDRISISHAAIWDSGLTDKTPRGNCRPDRYVSITRCMIACPPRPGLGQLHSIGWDGMACRGDEPRKATAYTA